MLSILPHLRGNVVVKVARILGMTEFGTVWRGVPVNIFPVNAAEPGMRLHSIVIIRHPPSGPSRTWRYTLIRCAPSTLPAAPVIEMKPLLLACTIIEFGLLTDDDACEPRRSSGSHRSCSIRLTPSWETRGREGKRRDCFQFRIFCRVTCRWKTASVCQ